MKKDVSKKQMLKKNKIFNALMNKKIVLIIIILVFVLGIVLLFKNVFRNSDGTIKYVQDINDPLLISEGKYLEFLWMVDGAFNYERYNKKDFVVNGKSLETKPDFTCKYDKNMKTCQGINFEENFKRLFAKSVNINRVYGDGLAIRWYQKKNDNYYFTNINSCDGARMSTNQSLKIVESNSEKIVCKVTYDENIKSGNYKGQRHYDKEFVLVREDNDWKVSKAYYHNPCYMEHNVY